MKTKKKVAKKSRGTTRHISNLPKKKTTTKTKPARAKHTMEPSKNLPYTLQEENEKVMVLSFAPICDHVRTKKYEKELEDLIEKYSTIVCDLTNTENISSDWLRWLTRLTFTANQRGKTFALTGVNSMILEKAEIIAVHKKLTIRN